LTAASAGSIQNIKQKNRCRMALIQQGRNLDFSSKDEILAVVEQLHLKGIADAAIKLGIMETVQESEEDGKKMYLPEFRDAIDRFLSSWYAAAYTTESVQNRPMSQVNKFFPLLNNNFQDIFFSIFLR
jgi:hypothetical protein